MRKIYLLITAVMLTLCLVGCGSEGAVSSGETESPFDPADYTPAEAFEFADGIIAAYIGDFEVVHIPPKIDGKDVISIGENAFEKVEHLTEVYLPDSCKTIENRAFYFAENLRVVDFARVETIGEEAFVFTSIEKVHLPDSCKSIGNKAFDLKNAVDGEPSSEIIIPASVEYLGEGALSSNRITRVTFESKTLPEMADGCLSSIKGVVMVHNDFTEEEAADVMKTLQKAGIFNTVQVMRIDGTPLFIDYSAYDFNKGDGTLYRYNGDDTVIVIPATINGVKVKKIGDSFINSNETVTEVIISEGVEEIGDRAFFGCTALEKITIPDSVTTVGEQVFFETKSLKSVTWPKNADIPDSAFQHSGLESIIIPNGVKIIADEAFRYCENLKSVEMADSVVEMGAYAFGYCNSLTTIDFLSKGLTEIPERAFVNCNSVETVYIPEGVTNIQEFAFSGCGWRADVDYAEIGGKYAYFVADPTIYGDNWVQDDRLPRFVTFYLPSTIEYIGNAVFSNILINGIYLPEGMHEVSQLPEFDQRAFSPKKFGQIYLDADTTSQQMDAMDQFFMGLDNMWDVCWYDEGRMFYYFREEIESLS